jgi:hypothetical protein
MQAFQSAEKLEEKKLHYSAEMHAYLLATRYFREGQSDYLERAIRKKKQQ